VLDGELSQRAQDDAALTVKIRAIQAASRGQYGAPRVLAERRAQGHDDIGRKRVPRLMKAAGLQGRRPPRWVRTTIPDPTPPAIPDLVHGQFEAAAPDVLGVGDITYIRTWEGWLYLATVIDVFSRRVLGFALADHMRALLVCDSLQLAVATRGGNVDRVIFHSDRGGQYSSTEFRALCDAHGVKQTMGKTGVCWDCARRVLLRDLQARAHRAAVLTDAGSRTERDRPLDRSRLQPPASALCRRHAEPWRLRGPILESPRRGLAQVSAGAGQLQVASEAR
jgi:transposase InsO family protein